MMPTSVEQTEQLTLCNVSAPAKPDSLSADVLSPDVLPLFPFLGLECFSANTWSLLTLQFITNTALYWVTYFSCLQNQAQALRNVAYLTIHTNVWVTNANSGNRWHITYTLLKSKTRVRSQNHGHIIAAISYSEIVFTLQEMKSTHIYTIMFSKHNSESSLNMCSTYSSSKTQAENSLECPR